MLRFIPLLLLTASLFGQVFEVGATGGLSKIMNNGLGSTASQPNSPATNLSLADGWRLGFRMAINNFRYFGNEFGYAYNRTKLRFDTAPPQEQGMAIHQGFYNFLAYAQEEGKRVRPFAAGGVHFSNFVPPGSSASYGGGSTKFGINYGGGLKIHLSGKFGIRFDYRQYQTPKPFGLPGASGWLRQNEISAGFSYLMM